MQEERAEFEKRNGSDSKKKGLADAMGITTERPRAQIKEIGASKVREQEAAQKFREKAQQKKEQQKVFEFLSPEEAYHYAKYQQKHRQFLVTKHCLRDTSEGEVTSKEEEQPQERREKIQRSEKKRSFREVADKMLDNPSPGQREVCEQALEAEIGKNPRIPKEHQRKKKAENEKTRRIRQRDHHRDHRGTKPIVFKRSDRKVWSAMVSRL